MRVADSIDLTQPADRRPGVIHHDIEQLGKALPHPSSARDAVGDLVEIGREAEPVITALSEPTRSAKHFIRAILPSVSMS